MQTAAAGPETVNGWTGHEPKPDENDPKYADDPCGYRYEHDRDSWRAAKALPAVVRALVSKDILAEAAVTALKAEDKAWQALDTTPSNHWLAAHHCWVKAATAARHHLNRWHQHRTDDYGVSEDDCDVVIRMVPADRLPQPKATDYDLWRLPRLYDYESRIKSQEELAGKTLRRLPV